MNTASPSAKRIIAARIKYIVEVAWRGDASSRSSFVTCERSSMGRLTGYTGIENFWVSAPATIVEEELWGGVAFVSVVSALEEAPAMFC